MYGLTKERYMYYKLLNKNLITATLVSLMLLGTIDTCDAQGVVSLDNAAEVETDANNQALPADDFDEFNLEIDAEIPDNLEEDEGIIPLDDGLISPAPAVATPEEAPVAELAPAPVAEPAPAPVAAPVPAAIKNAAPVVPAAANNFPQAQEDFSLGLDESLPGDIVPAAPAKESAKAPLAVNGPLLGGIAKADRNSDKDRFAAGVLSRTNNDLFSQMSDIEKQTTLLTLELRREKIRSEIEAIKAQRTKAEEEKIRAEEERKLKEIEAQKEQELKILKEQQILADKEMELEKVRQRKALNAYMNQMLEQNQKWINENAIIYKKLQEVEENRKEMAVDFKSKIDNLNTLSNKLVQRANSAKNNHDRTVASLTAQNIQLKKRIEADAKAAEEAAKNGSAQQGNPFSQNTDQDSLTTESDDSGNIVNIAQEYAIMDITGRAGELVAKLMNKEGDSFIARRGTVLHTGHIVEEIDPSFIRFNRQGIRAYLYTTGSIEPSKMDGELEEEEVVVSKKPKPRARNEEPQDNNMRGMSSLPSLGSGMFVK